jgi:hypothetical protein
MKICYKTSSGSPKPFQTLYILCFCLFIIHKYNAVSILTKHSSWTLVITWSGMYNSKTNEFAFSTISDRRFHLTADLSNLSTQVFSFLIKLETFTIHLKKVLYGFSSAHSNCQHYHSCNLKPLLIKIRITRTEVLWYYNSLSDIQGDC